MFVEFFVSDHTGVVATAVPSKCIFVSLPQWRGDMLHIMNSVSQALHQSAEIF